MEEEAALVDLTFLSEFCRDNRQKMAEYIHTFLESLPAEIEKLKTAAATKQWEEIRSIVHSLKPQLTFIGLPLLETLTRQIGETAATAPDDPEVFNLIAELEKTSDETTNRLIASLLTLH